MGRLTDKRGEVICNNDNCYVLESECPICYDMACCEIRKIIQKLAEYEDLEEQGLLVKLPCKVGDVVYCFDYPRTDIVVVCEEEVEKVLIWENGISIETAWDIYRPNDFGKTVFLTKAEAEKALEEMEK